MKKNPMVLQDERITSIADTSYRLAYVFVTFALLIDVLIRSYKFQQSSWDLFGIVIGSGLVARVYQMRQRALPPKWSRPVLIVMMVSAVVAAILVVLYGMLKL